MKRKILFRGKTKSKDSKWIFGDLNNVFDGVFIFDRIDESELNSPDNYEVIPETVGQFTGLKDKNGKEIYEGDIVEIKDSLFVRFDLDPSESTDNIPEVYEDTESEVVFDCGAFCVTEPNSDVLLPIQAYEVLDIEVIGTIHDVKEQPVNEAT